MNKQVDRVTEAYYGYLGEEYAYSTKNRIHWLCERAKGENILDIGCSQGISSILIGREGKKVFGIDSDSDAIEYANKSLLNEDQDTLRSVEFEVANFLFDDIKGKVFDSILLGNVLQSVTDAEGAMEKAVKLLNDNGQIIITVPFGLNINEDQKKPYFLSDILSLQVNGLVINELDFFGTWIGVSFKKGDQGEKVDIDRDLLKKIEQSLLLIKIQPEISTHSVTRQSNGISTENSDTLEALDREKDKAVQSMKKAIYLGEQLASSLRNEEELLLAHKKLLKKYNALSNSRLGKLTLSYWQKRRRVFGGK